jgi:hypothetical protein
VGALTEPLTFQTADRLRRIDSDGIVRIVVEIDGKLLEPKIWNSTGTARIWSIAVDSRKRVYTALPDIGQVIRIDPNGSNHVIDRYPGEWRVTAVATFGDAVFLLESSDKSNVGQRVRVIRGAGKAELLGPGRTTEINSRCQKFMSAVSEFRLTVFPPAPIKASRIRSA